MVARRVGHRRPKSASAREIEVQPLKRRANENLFCTLNILTWEGKYNHVRN